MQKVPRKKQKNSINIFVVSTHTIATYAVGTGFPAQNADPHTL